MLGAAVDWSSLTIAAAFVLGALVGTVGTLRVVRAVVLLLDPGRARPPRRLRRSDAEEEP